MGGLSSRASTARLQEQFGYAYDKAWNLQNRTNNALVQTFGVNNRNELTNATRSGTLTVAGLASQPGANLDHVAVSGTGLSAGNANVYADGSWARAGATLASGNNSYTATAEDTYGRTAQDSVTVNWRMASAVHCFDTNPTTGAKSREKQIAQHGRARHSVRAVGKPGFSCGAYGATRPTLSRTVVVTALVTWLWAMPLMAATNVTERELIRDLHFRNGFLLLEPKPGKRVVYGEVTDASASAKPTWDLCQWSSRLPLEAVRAERSPDGFLCFTNLAKRVGLGEGGADLSLGVNASVEYAGRARKTPTEPWVHLLVQQEIEQPPALADLAACRFHVEARLTRSKLFRTDDFSPSLHAAQFLIFLTVANRNPASPGYGQYFWFGIPLYDDRARMVPAYQAQDFGDTKMFIYTLASDVFTNQSTHDGQWVTFARELLPLLREGLAAGWQRGFMAGSRDEVDYRLTGIVIGWEVPGVFDVELQLRNLSLRASTAPSARQSE
ncbi:MAG: hypothetical protein KIS67_10040 [Verrucomicrobiae bacterium]|nr:hypothetical protein [Verrucomicrobiae bacterium]